MNINTEISKIKNKQESIEERLNRLEDLSKHHRKLIESSVDNIGKLLKVVDKITKILSK